MFGDRERTANDPARTGRQHKAVAPFMVHSREREEVVSVLVCFSHVPWRNNRIKEIMEHLVLNMFWHVLRRHRVTCLGFAKSRILFEAQSGSGVGIDTEPSVRPLCSLQVYLSTFSESSQCRKWSSTIGNWKDYRRRKQQFKNRNNETVWN